MKDPFDVAAYQGLLNRHIAAVQSAHFWVTHNRRHSDVREDQEKALARSLDEERNLVDAVTDFIRRHCEFAIRRLNALKGLEGPSPFGPELEAKLRRSLEAVERLPNVCVIGQVSQAVREADGEYQLQLESLRLKLAEKARKPKPKPKQKPGPKGPRYDPKTDKDTYDRYKASGYRSKEEFARKEMGADTRAKLREALRSIERGYRRRKNERLE